MVFRNVPTLSSQTLFPEPNAPFSLFRCLSGFASLYLSSSLPLSLPSRAEHPTLSSETLFPGPNTLLSPSLSIAHCHSTSPPSLLLSTTLSTLLNLTPIYPYLSRTISLPPFLTVSLPTSLSSFLSLSTLTYPIN